MPRVLVVDDEPQILRALRLVLTARGYEVQTATTGQQALVTAAQGNPDLVVLDLGLPDLEGVEVIRGLRGWSGVPVIVLSGRSDSADKVEALDAGADDYLTKPFDVDELLARARAVTRRTTAPEEATPTIDVGRNRVDFAARTVQRTAPAGPAETVHLTPTEWQLLELLARHPGRLITQRQLLQHVWGPAYGEETNYLRQFMAQLRRKLEDDPPRPRHLLTEPGMGYRYQP